MARYYQLVEKLNREICQTILENYGFAVYQDTSLGDLRETIRQSLLNRTISKDYVEGFLNNSSF